MKRISSLILVLFLANIALSATGQQEEKQEQKPQERTPIQGNNVVEATVTGVLEMENDMVFLVLKTGERYAIDPNKGGGPDGEGGPRGDGPPPGGQGGGPDSSDSDSDEMPPPPGEGSDQFAEYMGLEAVIQGKILDAPPHDDNLKDVKGVIFPESILINGEEMLK